MVLLAMIPANLKVLFYLQVFTITLEFYAVCLNMNDVGIRDVQMSGTILQVIENTGFILCAKECEVLSSCEAVNFNQSSLLCELLSTPLIGNKSSKGWRFAGNLTWLEDNRISSGIEQDICPIANQMVKLSSGNVTCSKLVFPVDCRNIKYDGVYTISPQNSDRVFSVHCDLDTDNKAWTVIQARVDGCVEFNRSWTEYKNPFGNFKSFWLGNDNIHSLVSADNYSLRVDMEYFDGTKPYAEYLTFYIAGEDDKYRLKVGGYDGNAGDDLSSHDGMAFSTWDSDHDINSDVNCALKYNGGWWFGACYDAFLNGIYFDSPVLTESETWKGIHWESVKTGSVSMKSVSMKIRAI